MKFGGEMQQGAVGRGVDQIDRDQGRQGYRDRDVEEGHAVTINALAVAPG